MPKKSKPSPVLALNEEQKAMVSAREGVYAVLAGPGAGKSSCLIERYKRLIASGVSPRDILSLTFSANAARHMRDKADFQKTEDSWWRPHGFLTFHSLALSFATIEREVFPYKLAAFPLATEGQTAKLLGETSRKFHVDFKTLKNQISLWKRDCLDPKQALKLSEDEPLYSQAYEDFEERRQAVGVLDFDSLMMEMTDILERYVIVRDRWSYKWLQADEGQDTDACQYNALWQMAKKFRNLLVVGDENQCIFSWRGAQAGMVETVVKMFPEAEKIFLATNYRSSSEIVDFCKKIAPCPELGDRFHTNNPRGVPPTIHPFSNAFAEAEHIVGEIKELCFPYTK